MIWATVSSWFWFCWLHRASPSLAAKNILNLILVLTSGDVHVYSHLLCCWKRVFAMTSAFSWQNFVSLCPASFCIPRPNLPITPGVSWLPTFASQSPIMKRTSFLGFQWSCMDVRVGLWRKLSAEELMLLNCGVGEDSWESLGLQGDPTSPF